MDTPFKRFIEAEIACMKSELGKKLLSDDSNQNQCLMEWIRENAPRFRAQWDENNSSADRDTSA